MGNLVCDGTEFSCPFCTSKLKLSVPSSCATGDSKNLANVSNSLFPPPGGNCIVCPSAPVPCTPAAVVVDPGQKPVFIDGLPALGTGCKFQCAKGGLLTVSSPGQTSAKHEEATGAQELSFFEKALNLGKNVVNAVVDAGKKAVEAVENFAEAHPVATEVIVTAAVAILTKGKGRKAPRGPTRSSPGNARGPVGRKGNEHVNAPYQKTRNARTTIQNRSYSGHALDQMQNRGIPPSVVENTIANGSPMKRVVEGKITTNYYDKINNISVVTNEQGGVITVGHGMIGKPGM